jgi:dsRNA-specific ribonuclease
MELEFLKPEKISQKFFEILKKFQNKFWHDLKKEKIQPESGQLSEVNYLVVPLKSGEVNNKKIEKCLKESSKPFDQIPILKREKCIWTNIKDFSKVKFLSIVPSNIFSFFSLLIGPKHPDFLSFVSSAKGKKVIDLIQKEPLAIQALEKFPYKEESLTLSELAFIKNTRSVVYDPERYSKQPWFPLGTPIVKTSQLFKFYLNKHEMSQVFTLIDSLIKIEHLSLAIELSARITYEGRVDLMRKAMTSKSADKNFNYESLETVGDTVLKFLVSLSLYLYQQGLDEGDYTRLRGFLVSNKMLAEIGSRLELKYWIRTAFPKHAKYVPAYYYNFQVKNLAFLDVEQKVTDSVLADFMEAIIGCVYIGENIEKAARFLSKIGLISNFSSIFEYLTRDKIAIQLKEDTFGLYTQVGTLFAGKQVNINEPFITIGEYKYKFKSLETFFKVFTHSSVNRLKNYETFEFLGDAVLDLLVLSSLYFFKEFDPSLLSCFKQLIVCNQNLSCISLVTGLYKYLKSITLEKIPQSFVESVLEHDILKITSLSLDKQLGDILESLIGGILIDSKSLLEASRLISELFSRQLSFTLKFHKEYLFISTFTSHQKTSPLPKQFKRI